MEEYIFTVFCKAGHFIGDKQIDDRWVDGWMGFWPGHLWASVSEHGAED